MNTPPPSLGMLDRGPRTGVRELRVLPVSLGPSEEQRARESKSASRQEKDSERATDSQVLREC